MAKVVTVDGKVFRVDEKPTHIVIYRCYGTGPYRDHLAWDSRKSRLKFNSVYSRALAQAAL